MENCSALIVGIVIAVVLLIHCLFLPVLCVADDLHFCLFRRSYVFLSFLLLLVPRSSLPLLCTFFLSLLGHAVSRAMELKLVGPVMGGAYTVGIFSHFPHLVNIFFLGGGGGVLFLLVKPENLGLAVDKHVRSCDLGVSVFLFLPGQSYLSVTVSIRWALFLSE